MHKNVSFGSFYFMEYYRNDYKFGWLSMTRFPVWSILIFYYVTNGISNQETNNQVWCVIGGKFVAFRKTLNIFVARVNPDARKKRKAFAEKSHLKPTGYVQYTKGYYKRCIADKWNKLVFYDYVLDICITLQQVCSLVKENQNSNLLCSKF